MNLKQLRRVAHWADWLARGTRWVADELGKAVQESDAAGDPLGAHIYRARMKYRRVSDGDKSKSGKATLHELEWSYRRAMELGFTGPFSLWKLVMQTGPAMWARLAAQQDAAATGGPAGAQSGNARGGAPPVKS